jgi:hypothetical protein
MGKLIELMEKLILVVQLIYIQDLTIIIVSDI